MNLNNNNMKTFKIKPSIEKKVEQMFMLGQQVSDLKILHPACWNIIKKEFCLGSSYDDVKFKDSFDNIKVRLYAEIVRKENMDKTKKEYAIKKQLQNE